MARILPSDSDFLPVELAAFGRPFFTLGLPEMAFFKSVIFPC
jgi:hypothetical protein